MTQIDLLRELKALGASKVVLEDGEVTCVEFYPSFGEENPSLDPVTADVMEDIRKKAAQAEQERLVYGSA